VEGAVSRQQLGKHISAVTDTHATTEELFEKVFLLGTCKGIIRRTIEAKIVKLERNRRSERT
jgi:hypothetical protein